MVYSGNRFLTQDEMQVNAQYIFDFLAARGWTKNAVAGILGNMQTESTINPGIWEGLNEGNTSGGFGLVQWTPATKYFDWCTPLNLTPEEMDSNLKRILYEVENGIQWGNDSSGSPPPYTFQQFTQSTDSAYNLGMNFLRYYERPLNPDQPDRGNQAEFWFSFFQGSPSGSGGKKSKIFLMLSKNKRRLIYP
jgi:hypothetical protein